VDLSGHTALVTGAARNIGRATALALAAAGAHVIGTWVTPSSRDLVAAACAEIRSAGGSAETLELDLADPAAANRTVHERVATGGVIDIVVHNAAIRPRTKLLDIDDAEWTLVHDTNLKAPFFVNQAVIPGMARRGWGRIVHISGLDAYWGNPQRAHVVASKLGAVGLVRAQANEVARWGITVNAVVPGTIDTVRPHPEWYPEAANRYAERERQIPMGHTGTSEDIARACLFLASPDAGYITGQELHVTGGAFPLVRQPDREYALPAEA
jgi:NAD(P)-dependent dehydrogenase (short-subunit alcohol dehydrogenase family)